MWSQVARSRRSAHGRRSTQHPGGAHTVPDATHCPTDCCWHGVPGLAALCPQRLGHQELPGRGKPAGQDRGLWHVQGRLQHRLLQSESPACSLPLSLSHSLTHSNTRTEGNMEMKSHSLQYVIRFFLNSSFSPKRVNSC